MNLTNTFDVHWFYDRCSMNPANTFDALVNWFYDLIVWKQAPGFLVGLSGTDSIVSFLAANKALERAASESSGELAERMMGIHFAPSEDFLYDHPEAESHLWFHDKIMPWLQEQAPKAWILSDTSVDWRDDGSRWGSLMDRSVVAKRPSGRRVMREPENQYWVVGTRNKSEDTLLYYSNASMAVSVQPTLHLWKSEILQLAEYLGVPKIAIDKSCETDCICGRMALASNHIQEVDWILQGNSDKVPEPLRGQLNKFINAQISKNAFKKESRTAPILMF